MYQGHLSCCILTFKNIIRTLLLAFWPLSKRSMPYFRVFKRQRHTLYVSCYRLQKPNYFFFVNNLTSKDINGTLWVFCLSLNMLFLTFSDILTSKFINHCYLVAVYTLNTPSATYFSVYNREKCHIHLSCWPFTVKTSVVDFFLL